MPDNSQGYLYASIAPGLLSDVVLSPDGSTFYVANTSGQLLVYDVVSRTLEATWEVGNTLGGIDVSPDGSFLLVAEREPVAHHPATGTTDASTTLTAYRVAIATGEVTNLPVTITGTFTDGFYDVEILNDGKARLTQEMYHTQVRELDIASGQYSLIGPSYGGQGVLVGSNDHTRALFTSQNQTPSELAVFGATGIPISYWSGHQDPDHAYPADGLLALSLEAGLIVQHQYLEWQGVLYTQLLVFDDTLENFFDLVTLHPEWADGRISGLAFDAAGVNLFVLDDDTDTIVQLSTSDWSVIRSFQVGTDIGDFAEGHFGNRLLITPDDRYFTVVTPTGVQLVENDAFANNFIGTAAADDLSAGLGDDMISGVGGNDHLRGDSGNDTLVGGEGEDQIEGGTGIDTLAGGAGADTFRDTKAGLSGDTITDLAEGDKIVITDATLAGFTFSLTGNTLTYTGGSLTFGTALTGQLVARAAESFGVELVLNDARSDFNGDGRSDILWRNADGTIGDWLANANGSHSANDASLTGAPTSWQIAGTGDFNGDGRDDILWRGEAGEVGNWLASQTGVFSYNAAAGIVGAPISWDVAGIGDFNDDGRDDILWRNSDGTIGTWLANPSGGHAFDSASISTVSTYWQIAGAGDFNKDGRDDILWRGDGGEIGNWLASSSGGFAYNAAAGVAGAPNDWHVAGVGDFNGDGRDDILWRNSDGTIANWLANASGGHAPNNASLVHVPNDWQIDAIGDFNGDGRDDILWRGAGGEVGNWLAGLDGTFSYNAAAGITGVPTSWQVEPECLLV